MSAWLCSEICSTRISKADVGNVRLWHFSFDTLFIGADGVDMTAGVTTFNEVFAVSQAMCHAAKKIVLLVDSSKFGRRSPNVVSNLDAVDVLITDSDLTSDTLAQLGEKGIEVIIAGDE